MDKKTESCLTELIDRRWSRRSFSGEKVRDEDLLKIFEAGRQVASSYNEQPWCFIFAAKGDTHYQKLFDCLGEFNQTWCKTARYLAVALGRTRFAKNDKENRHCFHDVGAFLSVASLQATELGLFVHEMAGFSPDKVKENFDIPGVYEPITMFVLGKPGDMDQLPEDLRKKEDPDSPRKEVSEFLYGGEWGKAYKLNR